MNWNANLNRLIALNCQLLKGVIQNSVFISCFSIFLLTACTNRDAQSMSEARERLFDNDWKFLRDSIAGAESPAFDDSKWRIVDLPHDWSIEDIPQQVDGKTIGPFSMESPGGTATGHVLGGTGWYRKKFVVDNVDTGKLISLYFEGAYMESDVWLNGHHLGYHPYGYTGFTYDITKHYLRNGQPNILAVRVVNRGKNSRWYSGSGLYRHVWLIAKNPLSIDQWGVFITTPTVTHENATVEISTSISNAGGKEIKLATKIIDAEGNTVGTAETSVSKSNQDKPTFAQQLNIKEPKLWSPDSPHLYTAEVSVFDGNKKSDINKISFGIRDIRFSAANGFQLNGQSIELKGGCVHHDNGILGSAAIDRAEERRIEILKANGFNAVRCSHNPPSEKFLEACDRLGMFVIDEGFDQWQQPKNPEDYHRFFDQWWERDLSAMVLRDRNHPSIIMWSIGNEVHERADPPGIEIAKKLKAKVRELDSTRPVTEAICEFWDFRGRKWAETAPAFAVLDVQGYNYQMTKYESDHDSFPNRIMMGTESVPQHAYENWQLVEKHPYVIGDFVWTAIDYLGESGIGHATTDTGHMQFAKPWPWFNAYCGDIDVIGFKKPQSYFRDVVWKRSVIEMAVHTPLPQGTEERISYWGWPDEQQSWTWPGQEGKLLDVNVYSRAQLVKLELNGKLIGQRQIHDSSRLTAKFMVAYQSGILKATAYDGGEAIGSVVLATRNAPTHIHLIPDRSKIKATRNDLSYVSVEIVDDQDRLVPNAEIPVTFSISGDGEIAGIGSANPADMSSFKGGTKKTFRGRCMVILRPNGKTGEIKLTATSNGLGNGEVVVDVEE